MIERVLQAIRTKPKQQDVLELLIALILFSVLVAFVSLFTGLASWSPLALSQLPLLVLRSLFIPALGEELIFRAALVPAQEENKRAAVWIVVSTLLFVLWHPIETLYLPDAASIFLRPEFLVLAAALGFICAVLRFRSGSIWTAVVFHWLAVVAWQGWFGGPSVLESMQ